MAFGWFIRSLHKWAATLMIAAVILHQIRVFFTGAYRRPREINWFVGMCLLLCTLMTGFTGYSLVFEQLSFWGATVGANIADATPLVGGFLKNMMLGGESYNQATLSRFFVLHAAILPVTIVLLVAVHITIIRLQGITEFRFKDEESGAPKTFNFFPDHLYTELMIGLVLMILLSALATIFPATLGPAANPLQTPEIIKPEWFFYVAFRWLKLFSGTAAILSMGFVLFVMFTWPFIDALDPEKDPIPGSIRLGGNPGSPGHHRPDRLGSHRQALRHIHDTREQTHRHRFAGRPVPPFPGVRPVDGDGPKSRGGGPPGGPRLGSGRFGGVRGLPRRGEPRDRHPLDGFHPRRDRGGVLGLPPGAADRTRRLPPQRRAHRHRGDPQGLCPVP